MREKEILRRIKEMARREHQKDVYKIKEKISRDEKRELKGRVERG